MKTSQQGNVLLISLILIGVIAAGGYYIYSQNALNTNSYQSGYTLATTSPQATGGPVSTSSEMTLVLTSPLDGVTLSTQTVIISGKTAPNADVFVNDQETKADASGNFTLKVDLDEGENNLIVSANDAEGNVVEQNLSVNVQTF